MIFSLECLDRVLTIVSKSMPSSETSLIISSSVGNLCLVVRNKLIISLIFSICLFCL